MRLDPKKLIEHVGIDEAAIDTRLFALRADSDHHDERDLMTDAQRTLRALPYCEISAARGSLERFRRCLAQLCELLGCRTEYSQVGLTARQFSHHRTLRIRARCRIGAS